MAHRHRPHPHTTVLREHAILGSFSFSSSSPIVHSAPAHATLIVGFIRQHRRLHHPAVSGWERWKRKMEGVAHSGHIILRARRNRKSPAFRGFLIEDIGL
ncbi:hypothetical protein DPEC_G00369600 [Dallia pectoralis]|nr:hypothetical protein DPEC_G00369600 [Dallia pectoralis]